MIKTYLGYSKENKIGLPIKLLLFICLSVISFTNLSFFLKIIIILILIILRFILIGFNLKSFKLYIFLFISSLMIILFWLLFENENLLQEIANAITKLWLLLLSGNVLLLSVSQDELIRYLKIIKCSPHIILFIIVSMNSLYFFISSFKEICKCYVARSDKKNIIRKYVYVLKTMSIDCLFLIVECKKIYTIYYKRILSQLGSET